MGKTIKLGRKCKLKTKTRAIRFYIKDRRDRELRYAEEEKRKEENSSTVFNLFNLKVMDESQKSWGY